MEDAAIFSPFQLVMPPMFSDIQVSDIYVPVVCNAVIRNDRQGYVYVCIYVLLLQ